jgi:hypothetical protein
VKHFASLVHQLPRGLVYHQEITLTVKDVQVLLALVQVLGVVRELGLERNVIVDFDFVGSIGDATIHLYVAAANPQLKEAACQAWTDIGQQFIQTHIFSTGTVDSDVDDTMRGGQSSLKTYFAA